jgi:hypothetical protein
VASCLVSCARADAWDVATLPASDDAFATARENAPVASPVGAALAGGSPVFETVLETAPLMAVSGSKVMFRLGLKFEELFSHRSRYGKVIEPS